MTRRDQKALAQVIRDTDPYDLYFSDGTRTYFDGVLDAKQSIALRLANTFSLGVEFLADCGLEP